MLALSGIRAYEVNMDGIVKGYLVARQVIEVFVYDGTIDDAFAHGRTQVRAAAGRQLGYHVGPNERMTLLYSCDAAASPLRLLNLFLLLYDQIVFALT